MISSEGSPPSSGSPPPEPPPPGNEDENTTNDYDNRPPLQSTYCARHFTKLAEDSALQGVPSLVAGGSPQTLQPVSSSHVAKAPSLTFASPASPVCAYKELDKAE